MDYSGHLQSMHALWEPAGNKLWLSAVMPAVLSSLGEVATSSNRHTTCYTLFAAAQRQRSFSQSTLWTCSMPSFLLGDDGPIVIFHSSFSSSCPWSTVETMGDGVSQSKFSVDQRSFEYLSPRQRQIILT